MQEPGPTLHVTEAQPSHIIIIIPPLAAITAIWERSAMTVLTTRGHQSLHFWKKTSKFLDIMLISIYPIFERLAGMINPYLQFLKATNKTTCIYVLNMASRIAWLLYLALKIFCQNRAFLQFRKAWSLQTLDIGTVMNQIYCEKHLLCCMQFKNTVF